MNKTIHGIVLALFCAACFLLWGLLRLPGMMRIRGEQLALPAFTRLCMEIGPAVLTGMGILATVYCLWVCLRRTENRPSWVAFLATATGSLVLVTLPAVVAIYLPLIQAVQECSVK